MNTIIKKCNCGKELSVIEINTSGGIIITCIDREDDIFVKSKHNYIYIDAEITNKIREVINENHN